MDPSAPGFRGPHMMVCSWSTQISFLCLITFWVEIKNQRSWDLLAWSLALRILVIFVRQRDLAFLVLNWSWNMGESNFPKRKLKQKWPEFPPLEVSCQWQEKADKKWHYSYPITLPGICSLPFPSPFGLGWIYPTLKYFISLKVLFNWIFPVPLNVEFG